MNSSYLRIKLRKSQSTLPTEQLTKNITHLEIIGDSIESLPDLDGLANCKSLLIICPQLREIKALPEHLTILKIKGAMTSPTKLPQTLETLQLSALKSEGIQELSLPEGLINLDLSNNNLTSLEGLRLGAPLGRLNLDHNQLRELPEDLYQNKSLLHLSLDGNPLTDEQKDRIYKTFGIWF